MTNLESSDQEAHKERGSNSTRVEFELSLTLDDLHQGLNDYYWNRRNAGRRFPILIAFAFAAAIFLSAPLRFVFLFLATLMTTVALGYRLASRRTARQLLKSKINSANYAYCFEDDGFSFTSEDQEGKQNWELALKWYESDFGFFLLTATSLIIIPKRVLSKTDCNNLTALFSRHIKTREKPWAMNFLDYRGIEDRK